MSGAKNPFIPWTFPFKNDLGDECKTHGVCRWPQHDGLLKCTLHLSDFSWGIFFLSPLSLSLSLSLSISLSLSLAQLNLAPEALRLMPYVVTLSLTSFPNCRRLIRADETQALRNSCHTTELKLLPNAKCSVSLAQSRHLLPARAFRQASEKPSIACIFLKNIMTNIKIHMLIAHY